MLLDGNPEVRRAQLRIIAKQAEADFMPFLESLLGPLDEAMPQARLPLIDIATAALRELTISQYSAFRTNVVALAKADETLSLFEWVLERMILRHLDPQFAKVKTAPAQYYALTRLQQPCAVLLSALAHHGHSETAQARKAFEQGRFRLGLSGLELLAPAECSLEELDKALSALDTVSFKLKRNLLEAGAAAVSADRQVTVIEAELLRGIADALGCPMPPLLPGQPLT